MKKYDLSKAFLTISVLISLALGLLPTVGLAQTGVAAAADYAKGIATIEEKVDARRKELGIPGMSLAIVKDDSVILSRGFGFKDFEKKVPVTADTELAIGSATKAFTALSVLMTADEGKISLDASPRTVLPYFKMYDPDTDKNMTIRDLLTHSSGLNRTDIAMITGKLTRQELIRVAGEAKPIGKLREKFGYQNLMYATAGEVVAVAQKEPWEKFVPERIFKPLGMTNSTMTIAQMEKTKDYSFGYTYNFDTKETTKQPFRPIDEVAPAGSINSSANDMTKWLRFILNGGTTQDGKRLVSTSNFAEWLKPQMKMNANGTAHYALGWMVMKWNGLTVVQHGGNIDGFNALVAMIPEKKLGFVMLTNVSASSLGNELMPIVWENILGKQENSNVASQPKPSGDVSTSSSPAARELIGKYRGVAAPLEMEIKDNDGKVQLVVPGQPPYTLADSGTKDAFKPLPLPDGFLLKVKRGSDGKLSSLVMAQPQGELELLPIPSNEQPPITVDELYAKTLAASGGEANWRKLTSRVTTSTSDLEQQGVKGESTSWSKAPNRSATETIMKALGKPIAKGWEFFDGTISEESYTFAPVEKLTGTRLDDVRLGADFYSMLDWKTKYRTITVKRIAKVGDEDAYVVEFEPEKGSKFTEYYSTKSFFLLKKEGVITSSTSGVSLPYSVVFSDYREVDGVKLPFKQVSTTPSSGDTVVVVTSVKHNVPIQDNFFVPRKLN